MQNCNISVGQSAWNLFFSVIHFLTAHTFICIFINWFFQLEGQGDFAERMKRFDWTGIELNSGVEESLHTVRWISLSHGDSSWFVVHITPRVENERCDWMGGVKRNIYRSSALAKSSERSAEMSVSLSPCYCAVFSPLKINVAGSATTLSNNISLAPYLYFVKTITLSLNFSLTWVEVSSFMVVSWCFFADHCKPWLWLCFSIS